jgi:hypothetical protein
MAWASVSMAASPVEVTVKIVLASREAKYHDPRLSELINELNSVFRYSSYRLINQARRRLSINETGSIPLPGSRVLQITPGPVQGNRVELKLHITKGGKTTFRTVVQLLNEGSLTVGGPKHQNGYLLFNITSSF